MRLNTTVVVYQLIYYYTYCCMLLCIYLSLFSLCLRLCSLVHMVTSMSDEKGRRTSVGQRYIHGMYTGCITRMREAKEEQECGMTSQCVSRNTLRFIGLLLILSHAQNTAKHTGCRLYTCVLYVCMYMHIVQHRVCIYARGMSLDNEALPLR